MEVALNSRLDFWVEMVVGILAGLPEHGRSSERHGLTGVFCRLVQTVDASRQTGVCVGGFIDL